MVNMNTFVGFTIVVLIVAVMDQTLATICDCDKWNDAYTYNYNGGHGKPGGVSGYCDKTCSFGNAATDGANDCCKCCCEKRSKYVGTCDIGPAVTTPAPTTLTTICDCNKWNDAYTYNYNGGHGKPGGVSGYCDQTCSYGNGATGGANDCCKCCCEKRSKYVGTCDIVPAATTPAPATPTGTIPTRTTPAPTTCTPTDNDCSIKSVFTGGFGFPFHTYFAGSGPAANGGAATYCPKGTRGYADCQVACKDDTHYDACVRCCEACCTSGNAGRN